MRTPGTISRLTCQRGMSLVELLVVVAVIMILAISSIPMFLSYYHNATLKAGAEELVTWLNQGRQLAIRENRSVCASVDGSGLHFHLDNCSGTVWVGAGTNATGHVSFPAGLTLSTSAEPIFNYLGAAAPAATFTLTNPTNGRSLRVVVSASGRINVSP